MIVFVTVLHGCEPTESRLYTLWHLSMYSVLQLLCCPDESGLMGTSINLLRTMITSLSRRVGIEILIPTCRDSGFEVYPDSIGTPSALYSRRSRQVIEVPS